LAIFSIVSTIDALLKPSTLQASETTMKELSATIIAFFLITPPALAQECQPDQYENIIDLGGGCISSEEVINNKAQLSFRGAN
jgi:hypothetical protein